MIARLSVAAAVVAAAVAFGMHNASAVPIAQQAGAVHAAAAEGNLVESTQWRYCRGVRAECRARWGGGWRYWRCVARRGCG
jgi:hypothetical protein